MIINGWRRAVLAVAACGASLASAPAQAPAILAFADVERGLWSLREGDGRSRAMCVADPAALFQLRGGSGNTCARFVVENEAKSATVQYSCPGSGQGRTTITVETPRLMRIESQGVEGGAPFALDIEARHTGTCR